MADDYKETVKTMLKILSDKSNIFFTSRGNESIQIAMLMASKLGRVHGLMQDEGGWLTYEKYISQAGLEPTRMVTFDGVIVPKELDHYGCDEVLLINSLAGYVALQNMEEINTYCMKNDVLLVNDVSGSVGLKAAKFGDIVLGSFGPAKPVNLGTGGFIAFDDEFLDIFEEVVTANSFEERNLDFEELEKKLKGLEARRKFLTDRCKKIKQELIDLDVVHAPDENALNVIVRFNNDDERNVIETYCADNSLEFTVCPREIRILDDAISIEVKRLKN